MNVPSQHTPPSASQRVRWPFRICIVREVPADSAAARRFGCAAKPDLWRVRGHVGPPGHEQLQHLPGRTAFLHRASEPPGRKVVTS